MRLRQAVRSSKTCGALSPASEPYPPLQLGRQDPSKTRWTTSKPMRLSRVFAKQLPHTDCIWICCPWAFKGTNVRKLDSVKQRQDVTHVLLIHGTQEAAAFIYPLAQDAHTQVPLAVGIF